MSPQRWGDRSRALSWAHRHLGPLILRGRDPSIRVTFPGTWECTGGGPARSSGFGAWCLDASPGALASAPPSSTSMSDASCLPRAAVCGPLSGGGGGRLGSATLHLGRSGVDMQHEVPRGGVASLPCLGPGHTGCDSSHPLSIPIPGPDPLGHGSLLPADAGVLGLRMPFRAGA